MSVHEPNYYCTGTEKSPNYLCKFGKNEKLGKWGWKTIHIFPTSNLACTAIGSWRFLKNDREESYRLGTGANRPIKPFYMSNMTAAVQHIYSLKRQADGTKLGELIFKEEDPFFDAIYAFNGRYMAQLTTFRKLLLDTIYFKAVYSTMRAAPEEAHKILKDDFTTADQKAIHTAKGLHKELDHIISEAHVVINTTDKEEIIDIFYKLVAKCFLREHPEHQTDNSCSKVFLQTPKSDSTISTEISKMYDNEPTTNSEEPIKEPFFEKVPTIMGTKARYMSDQDIYDAILQAEKRIEYLQSMKHKPKSALKEIQKLHKQLNKLVAWMDDNR